MARHPNDEPSAEDVERYEQRLDRLEGYLPAFERQLAKWEDEKQDEGGGNA
jgi:hypothetical protein